MIYRILNKNKLPDIIGRCALFGIVRIGDTYLHLQVYKRVGDIVELTPFVRETPETVFINGPINLTGIIEPVLNYTS